MSWNARAPSGPKSESNSSIGRSTTVTVIGKGHPFLSHGLQFLSASDLPQRVHFFLAMSILSFVGVRKYYHAIANISTNKKPPFPAGPPYGSGLDSVANGLGGVGVEFFLAAEVQ